MSEEHPENMAYRKRVLEYAAAFLAVAGVAVLAAFVLKHCIRHEGLSLTEAERELIFSGESVMRVLTVRDPEDVALLRGKACDFTQKDMESRDYRRLAERMVATVTSPEQDGVGIAGPQVGISRRIVAVQRFDMEGEPFVVYPNIRIVARRGEPVSGREGCLSVPDTSAMVMRSPEIDIEYYDIEGGKTVTETVTGFTAVIFQHETDHLEGILYTDYD